MQNRLQALSLVIGALCIFYIAWGLPQFFSEYQLFQPYINDAIFSYGFTLIAGAVLPIYVRRKLAYSYVEKSSLPALFGGSLLLLITVLIGVVFSEALSQTLSITYTFPLIVKYLLLFSAMAFALCIFAFLLIPKVLALFINRRSLHLIATLLFTALFFFIGFLVDTVFKDLELALTMGILGLLFALSHYLTKNFWLTYLGFFLTMLFNTLAENKYGNYSWLTLSLCFGGISITIIFDIFRCKARQGQS